MTAFVSASFHPETPQIQYHPWINFLSQVPIHAKTLGQNFQTENKTDTSLLIEFYELNPLSQVNKVQIKKAMIDEYGVSVWIGRKIF
jgi:hypothetical protein